MNYAEFLKSCSPYQRVRVVYTDGELFFVGEVRNAIPWRDMVVSKVKDFKEAGYTQPTKLVVVDDE